MKSLNVESDKSLLRKRLREKLAGLSSVRRSTKNRKIFKRVAGSACYRRARSILIYWARQDEVSTREIIRLALNDGKRVYIPKVKPGTKRLQYYPVKDLKMRMKKNEWGIREPSETKSGRSSGASLDLIIVPGLGFDRNKRRLGRGAGYFDRFLKRKRKAVRMGIAFREQIVSRVPSEKHDIKMNIVITD